MAKNYGQRARVCMHGVIKILHGLEYPIFWPHGARLRIDMIEGHIYSNILSSFTVQHY